MMWLFAESAEQPTGLSGAFIGFGLAGGLAALGWFLYKTAVKLIEMAERRAVRRQAEREGVMRDEKEEKQEYLAILSRVAQIQMDSSVVLSEHRTLMTTAMTTVAVNLDRLTNHVNNLTAEVRSFGREPGRTRRSSPPHQPPMRELPP